jgi:hypothetical protein
MLMYLIVLGVPKLYQYGVFGGKFQSFIVMELLGYSIVDIAKQWKESEDLTHSMKV